MKRSTKTIVRQYRHWLKNFDQATKGRARTRFGQDAVIANAKQGAKERYADIVELAANGDRQAGAYKDRMQFQLRQRNIVGPKE